MKQIVTIAATLAVAACSHMGEIQLSEKDKNAFKEAKQFSKEAHVAYLSYWHDDDLSIQKLWKKYHPKNQPELKDTSSRRSYQKNFIRAMSMLGAGHVIRDNGGDCPKVTDKDNTVNPFSSAVSVTCSNGKSFVLTPVKKVRWKINEK